MTRNHLQCEEKFENHYPITVLDRKYADVEKLNKNLVKLIESIEASDRETRRNAVKSGKITTSGGFQTALETNLFDLKNIFIEDLKTQVIQPGIESYFAEVFENKHKEIVTEITAWSNILEAGDWQRPHMHPTENNLISGCYYVQVPPLEGNEEGHIEFINPVPISVHHGYSNTRRIKPQAGQLLLFPPYYNHYVHPLKSPGRRIIIAFDVIAVKQKTQFVF